MHGPVNIKKQNKLSNAINTFKIQLRKKNITIHKQFRIPTDGSPRTTDWKKLR